MERVRLSKRSFRQRAFTRPRSFRQRAFGHRFLEALTIAVGEIRVRLISPAIVVIESALRRTFGYGPPITVTDATDNRTVLDSTPSITVKQRGQIRVTDNGHISGQN